MKNLPVIYKDSENINLIRRIIQEYQNQIAADNLIAPITPDDNLLLEHQQVNQIGNNQ